MTDASEVRDHPERNQLEIDLGDGIALSEYRRGTRHITFLHTDVPPGHEGQGIGSRLVRAGLALARAEGLKVIPICPFFAAWFRKHPEDRDLLDRDWFAKLDLPEAD